MNKKLFILAFVGELLTACQNDNYFFGNEVRISAGSDTRASGTVWQKQDSIGIFMFKNEDQSVLSHNIEHKNVFEDGAIAVFEPANINEKLYYPVDAAVDLLGYYPYQRGINGYNYKVDVSDQTNLPAIDLMTARKNEIRRTNSMQDLKFGHALSKIKLILKAEAGVMDQEIADAKVWIAGVSTKADYDLLNGGLKALETGNVAVPQSKGIAEAILVPQTDISEVLFMLDVYPRIFTVGVPKSTTAFGSGMEYCYTITIGLKEEITITLTSISPWEICENNGGVTLDIEYVKVPVTVEPFGMGSPSDEVGHKDTETQHQVTLTKGFMISKYEITGAQYAEFLNQSNAFVVPRKDEKPVCLEMKNGSLVELCLSYDGSGFNVQRSGYRWSGTDKPMTYVTWYGAKAFADWAGVELPTEAQWEYTCRAGTTTPWSFDPEMTDLFGSCVYRDSKYYRDSPNIGGSKRPNAFGVYDMHGNVPEWCLDYWDGVTPYSDQPVENPKGADSGTKCVVRGGGFDDTAELCRSASRSCELLNATRSTRDKLDIVQGLGFRVVINDK